VKNFYRPSAVHFNITSACNNRCIFCGNNSGKPMRNELKLRDLASFIDLLISDGVGAIWFLGGDPMVKKGFAHLVEKCFAHRVRVGLSTNGVFMSDEVVAAVERNAELLDFFQISLHAATRQHYARVHGRDNLGRVVQNIKALSERQIKFNISCVIGKHNLDEIVPIHRMLQGHGVKEVSLSRVCIIGRGQLNDNLGISFYDYLSTLAEWNTLNENKEMVVSTAFRPLVRSSLAEYFPNLEFRQTNCSLHSVFHVEADGMAMLCPFIRDDVNFVKEFDAFSVSLHNKARLDELWNSEPFVMFREYAHKRNRTKVFCAKCKYFENGQCVPCPLRDVVCNQQLEQIDRFFQLGGAARGKQFSLVHRPG